MTCRAFAYAPLAMEPVTAGALLTDLADRLDRGDLPTPEALQTRPGQPLDERGIAIRRGDAAILTVTGYLWRYDGWLPRLLGGTTLAALSLALTDALDNPAIRRIIMNFDSPGGEITGVHELAERIRAANRKKPVTAYIGGQCASAAYWLASATGRVVVDETAMVGSIGVIMSTLDTSKRDEAAGVRRIEIVSSQSPDKRLDATTDPGRAKLQTHVDTLADVFIADVARFRGTTADKVKRDFGRGGLLVGKAAIRAGMADSTGSLEGLIAATSTTSPTPAQPVASHTPPPAASAPAQAADPWHAVIARFTPGQTSAVEPEQAPAAPAAPPSFADLAADIYARRRGAR